MFCQIFLDFLISCWTGSVAWVFKMVFDFFIETLGFKYPGLSWMLWICYLDHWLAHWEVVKWHGLWESVSVHVSFGQQTPRVSAHLRDIAIKFRVVFFKNNYRNINKTFGILQRKHYKQVSWQYHGRNHIYTKILHEFFFAKIYIKKE